MQFSSNIKKYGSYRMVGGWGIFGGGWKRGRKGGRRKLGREGRGRDKKEEVSESDGLLTEVSLATVIGACSDSEL
jgi:hypothetical protein